MHPKPSGVVALLTDFGSRDPYVGVMRGAVLQHHRRATLVDLGHEVPAFDVAAGAFWLLAAVGRFPAGTVHVAVVDPGVGSPRRLLAASAHGCYWLAPDNGLLTHVLAGDAGAEVRVIEPGDLGLTDVSSTFHGRDVFAPVAGWLSGGRYGFRALGPRAERTEQLATVIGGEPRVMHVDGFGNLITNVARETAGAVEAAVVAGRTLAVRRTYAEVPVGGLLALWGSHGMLEIAQNQGSAARALGVGRDAAVELRRRGEEQA